MGQSIEERISYLSGVCSAYPDLVDELKELVNNHNEVTSGLSNSIVKYLESIDGIFFSVSN